jgi:Tol biopolymer transport system component
MSCLAVVLLSLSVSRAGDSPVQELLAQLDHDDVDVRERATKQLGELDPDAIPALEAAAKDATPEAAGRIAQALRAIRVNDVLRRPEAAVLRDRWADLDGAPAARRRAIFAWVRACGEKPETADFLLELLTADAGGAAGDAACEAMNWLCAPRRTRQVEARGSGHAWAEPMPALRHVESLVREGLEISDGARARLAAATLPPKRHGTIERELDQLRGVCARAGVAFRMDDDAGKVRLELAEEAAAAWREWWKGVRGDRLALMDLGLIVRPEGGSLTVEAAREWIARLSAADPRHARVARAVLRDASDEVVAEVARTPAPEARAFAARLALRKKGRLLYIEEEGGRRSQWAMRLDGSGRVRISGDLDMFWSVEPVAGGRRGFTCSRGADGAWGIYEFDLTGAAAPRRLLAAHAFVWARPDGSLLAFRPDEGGQLRQLDPATGDVTTLEEGRASTVLWSPDGKRLIWNCTNASDLKVWEAETRKTATWEGRMPCFTWPKWHPDGRRIAFARRDPPAGPPATMSAVVVDLLTGTEEVSIGPIETKSMGWPEWSPDGSLLSVAWFDKGDRPALALALRGEKDGKPRVVSRPVTVDREVFGQAGLRWSPDGRAAIASYPGVEKAQRYDLASDSWSDAAARDVTAVWIPGTEWLLAEQGSDVWLFSIDGREAVNLTESAVAESAPQFVAE